MHQVYHRLSFAEEFEYMAQIVEEGTREEIVIMLQATGPAAVSTVKEFLQAASG